MPRSGRSAPPTQDGPMSTFVLIHGAGDMGWYWHLVEAELRARGHDVVAPDLPGDDESLELNDYADGVVAAVGDRRNRPKSGVAPGAGGKLVKGATILARVPR